MRCVLWVFGNGDYHWNYPKISYSITLQKWLLLLLRTVLPCAVHPIANVNCCFCLVCAAGRLCLAISRGGSQLSSCADGEKGVLLTAVGCSTSGCPTRDPGCWRGNAKFCRAVDFVSGRCLLPSQCKLNACVPHHCQSPMTPSNLLRSLVRRGTAILPRGQVRVWERGGRFQVPPHSPAALAEKLGCSSSKRFGLGVKGGLPPLEGCATRLPWLVGRRNRFGLITCRRKWRTRCWYSQSCLLRWE